MKAILLCFLAFGLPSLAQTLTGDLTAFDHPEYAGVASHFRISNAEAGGEGIYDGELIMFCSDLAARSLDEDISSYPYQLTSANSSLSLGSLDQFDVWDRYSTSQDEALATAQLHWLVDNFYISHFLAAPSGEESLRQYAFQNVIWEIFGDGATSNGLDLTNGNIRRSKFGPSGSSSSPELWSEMNNLISAVENSGVTAAYEGRYEVFGVLDSRGGYQDYFAISAQPDTFAVPEPATGLMLIGCCALLLRRRR